MVALVCELAEELPPRDALRLAAALRSGVHAARVLRQQVAAPTLRAAITRVLAAAPDLTFAAGALSGAVAAVQRSRGQQLDVVWTGPASSVDSARLTPAVVSELLAEATTDVLLVGHAVQEGAGVTCGLLAAAERGVRITLLLERREDNAAFDQRGDPLRSIPARRLCWPADHRERSASLHAKVLVIDRRAALIGSANLTGAAMTRNLECGLLLRGGPHPARLCDHVEALLEQGVLRNLAP